MTFSFWLFLVCILVLLISEPRILYQIYILFYSCNSLLNLLREEYKTISLIVCFFIFFGPSLLCFISLKVYNIMGRKRIDRFSVLFGKIVSCEFSDFFQRQKLEDHEALLKKLKKNMIVIDAVLAINNFEPVIKSGDQIWWLNVLNGIILGLEDLLHDVSELEAKLKIIASPTTPNNGPSECIEEKMKEIIKEMDYFATIMGKQVSWTREPYQLSATDRFEDIFEVLRREEDIVEALGREEDKKAVLNLLLSHNNDDQIGIITIVGERGVGKSTLAQLVYNDHKVEEHFDIIKWIYISENCDSSRWDQIIESLLEWKFSLKKFLVILDDVRCGQEFILRYLQQHCDHVHWPNGSTIIVTTRFRAVAELWSLCPYHLKPITHEDSWRLFAKHAFADENSCSYGRLEAIGKKIVKNECYGLPLAAKVLGAVLRFKPTVEDWDAILKKTNISDDLIDTTTGLPPALVWSYYYLPAHLKQCFAFCAILPRSYEFEENQIIRYWKALGLLQQPDDHEIGHENFRGLVSRSFFQRSRGNRSSSFVMHDLLHELAQLVSQDERCDQANQDKGGTHLNKMPAETSVGPQERYKLHPISLCLTVAAYFKQGLSHIYWYLATPTSFKSFHISEGGFGSYPSSDIAATQDNLKSRKDGDVLKKKEDDLRRVNDEPCEVYWKIILDYLFSGDISRRLDEDLEEPSIKFYKVLSFPAFNFVMLVSLSNCNNCSHLPPFGQLPFLKNLNLEGMNQIEKVGFELFGKIYSSTQPFPSLQILTFRRMLEWQEWIFPEVEGGEFPHLQQLCIERCPKLKRSLPRCLPPSIENFEISECPSLEARFLTLTSEDFFWLQHGNRMLLRRVDKRPPAPGLPDSNVVKLKSYYEMASELSSTDVSITSLNSPPETSKISNEDSSIKHEGASEIPLEMTESSSHTDDPINPQISSLESLKVSEISQLLKLPPRLHTLKIEGCDALKSLSEELMINNIHLQQLYIIDCCFLESISVDHLPTTLKSLYIRNCRKLKFPSPSETKQHEFLEHLCIGSSCDSLSSFHLTLFPKLRSLAIWDCVNFSSISISKNHMSLDALEIRDCPKLLYFLKEELHTPNLTSIFLSNCKNLKEIPKHMNKLTSLRSFFINGCPELSSIINGCFPENLSSLCISNCHKLTPSSRWQMNELNNLSCFEIEGGCIDLKSFPEQNLLPSSLSSLQISRLSNLEFLDYKGLERLTSLETLKINGCDKLQSFPEEGLPSSVTYLYINECSLLKARFQNKRGKEWYKIAHVTHIEIDEEVMS